MLGDFRSKRAAKPAKKVRNQRRPWVPIFELLERREMLTTVNVSDVNDDGTSGSLRSVLAAAAATTGQSTYTINLTATESSGGDYSLGANGGELSIPAFANPNMTLIIEGQGSIGTNATTIKQTATDRVFQIAGGDTVIFEDLQITGGMAETDSSGGTSAAEGGGILNQGNLTLNDVAVYGNTAKATLADEVAMGGGIYTTGALTITGRTPGDSLIENNSATGIVGADAVNQGAGGSAEGGGVYTNTSAQVQITGTTISNNSATAGAGPTNTSVAGSGGWAFGGGFYTTYVNAAPTTLLDDDTIANNHAVGGAGGTGASGQSGGAGGYATGGGVAVEPTTASQAQGVPSVPVKISDSTISGNTAVTGAGGAAGSGGASAGTSDGAFGGGVGNAVATTEMLNDTVFGNSVNGLNGFSAGGGIYDDSIGMLIVNATIAQNSALASTGTQTYGGGLANAPFYNSANQLANTLQIANSLVASNTAINGTDFEGYAFEAVGDLINNPTGGNITNGNGNITLPTTLGLATSLANNGGNTLTLALSTGSAAIGAGDPTSASNLGLTTDQRGLPRTTAGLVDIGAYQTQAAGPTTTSTALSTSSSSINVGQSVAFTAVVSPAAGVIAAATGSVQFYVDGSLFGSPVALNVVNGVDEAVLNTSSLPAGTHVITAVYSGDSNFAASTSMAQTETVPNPSTTGSSTLVTANPNPVDSGASITFTATVTPASGSTAPGGTVLFEIDGVLVGSGVLNGVSGDDQATFSTSTLAAGSHTLTAIYTGDPLAFNGSVSPAVNPVTVYAPFGAPTIAGATSTAENHAVTGLLITPATSDTEATYFQITGITGGTLYYNGGSSQITNGQFITVASGAAGLEFIPTNNSVSGGGFTAQESTSNNSGGLVGNTTTHTIGINGTANVDLSGYFNLTGITTDGTSFSGGIDGGGNALSEAIVGNSLVWNGITYTLGAANVNDVVQATGQMIQLSPGNYSNITFLAVGTNGNQVNQQFLIHYSDGTTALAQSISDWAMPQAYANESVALPTAYRNTASGGRSTGTFDVYGYSIPVDPTRTVQSITLPNDTNIKILAMATQATLDPPTALGGSIGSGNSVNLTWTASDSGASSYNVYRYTLGNAASPTLIASGVTATNYTDNSGVPGNTYFYVVKAVNGSAISPASNASSTTIATTSPTTEVDLAGQYNLTGITTDGSKFSGGLDGQGNALSETLVGTSQTFNGVGFNIAPAGANNVIQTVGQTVALPSGSYSAIDLLATAVNGNQARQWFTVNYTDGSQVFVQSLSDWYAPQGNSGESVVDSMAYRNTSSGGRDGRTFNLYGYSLLLDSTKTVASITMPFNPNVDVLAIDMVAPVSAPTTLTVTAGSSTEAQLMWSGSSGTITGYNIYRGTTTGGESSTPINSTPLPIGATSYTDTTAVPGNTYYYIVKAVNGPAASAASNEVSVTLPTAASTISVDLSSQYNFNGITADGTAFPSGLDGHGNALSASQVGSSLTLGNVNFNFGPVGSNNVVLATGQTIGLPNGSYSQLDLLATAVNGSQMNQVFTINYADGSSQTVGQSVSDWAAPQGFSGESDAIQTDYRNTSKGGRGSGTFDIYGYSLPIDSSKTVVSITLPNNPDVAILAMNAIGVIASAPVVAASGNGPSTFTFGSAAVPVDSRLAISSIDANLTTATVTISAATKQTGDLLNFNNQNGISGSYSGGVLTLTGTSSVQNYQAALQSVTFSSTNTNTTPRSISIVASDNLLLGNTVSETVNVAPVVIPSGTTNTFTIGDSAAAVDAGVTVNSQDPDLMSASVTISAGTLQTGDLLIFNNQNNITGSFSGGVLTLTGSHTVADYVAALQSVTFSTSSATLTPRTLSIDVEDSNAVQSNVANETVDVTT